jgi:hypothetical protein
MALTASMKGQAIVSSSTQITNYYKFAETASANTFYGDQTITGSLAINDSATNFLIEGNPFGQTYLTAGGAIVLNPGYGGVEMVGSNRTFKATDITAEGFVSGEVRATNNVVSSSTQVQNYDVFALNSNLYTSTGSLIGITNGLMALTASMKSQAIVSSSNQIPELFRLMQATASLNTTTGSFSAIVNQILQTTASLNLKTGSYATTGSNTFIGTNIFSGSLYMSGSVYGNVTVQPVASNTSSIDISTANFFTITLGSGTGTSGVTTHISASNVRAGQSVNILVTTGTNSTASFSTNIKQPSGSFYLPTSGSGNKDVLSLVAFDTTSLYLVAVNQMI